VPTFDIVRETTPKKSFRVASVMGKFDLASTHIKERFVGDIHFGDDWQIGLIVGNSGTGKTTIAKELFPDSYVTNFDYKEQSILDDFPKEITVDQITRTFNSVGFSSPPSWLKPYSVLSNGQKMRVDLATSLLKDEPLIVFDEFTSVVDREVAKIGSHAIQKAIRRTNKKFIAVGCHFDVEDWLLPDWIFNTNDMTYSVTAKKKDQTLNSEYLKQKESPNIGKCLVNIII
jgi:ABC-type Mn2+/Zn2+ transport system ATPase subunit|tara:strand:+ start:1329 stop:2018 length:690 start_codon:yes stop_codon:yes gene_type:complete